MANNNSMAAGMPPEMDSMADKEACSHDINIEQDILQILSQLRQIILCEQVVSIDASRIPGLYYNHFQSLLPLSEEFNHKSYRDLIHAYGEQVGLKYVADGSAPPRIALWSHDNNHLSNHQIISDKVGKQTSNLRYSFSFDTDAVSFTEDFPEHLTSLQIERIFEHVSELSQLLSENHGAVYLSRLETVYEKRFNKPLEFVVPLSQIVDSSGDSLLVYDSVLGSFLTFGFNYQTNFADFASKLQQLLLRQSDLQLEFQKLANVYVSQYHEYPLAPLELFLQNDECRFLFSVVERDGSSWLTLAKCNEESSTKTLSMQNEKMDQLVVENFNHLSKPNNIPSLFDLEEVLSANLSTDNNLSYLFSSSINYSRQPTSCKDISEITMTAFDSSSTSRLPHPIPNPKPACIEDSSKNDGKNIGMNDESPSSTESQHPTDRHMLIDSRNDYSLRHFKPPKSHQQHSFLSTSGFSSCSLDGLLDLLPEELSSSILGKKTVSEISLEIGERPKAKLKTGDVEYLNEDEDFIITCEHLKDIDDKCGDTFRLDNCHGISKELHKIYGVRNRYGTLTRVTVLIGWFYLGCADILEDLLFKNVNFSYYSRPRSILICGKRKSGKSTLLRDMARKLSQVEREVFVMDSICDIGGPSDIQHWSAGSAKRLTACPSRHQTSLLQDCINLFNPKSLLIDRITLQDTEVCLDAKNSGSRILAGITATLEEIIFDPDYNAIVLSSLFDTIIQVNDINKFEILDKSSEKTLIPSVESDCLQVDVRERHASGLGFVLSNRTIDVTRS